MNSTGSSVGYFINELGTCSECGQHCNYCQSETSCIECTNSTSTVLIDGKCMLCSDLIVNCTTCSSKTVCTKCSPGFKVVGSACISCIANCTNCDDSICSECMVGYYFDSTVCLQCPKGCKECLSATSCKSSQEGYYLENNVAYKCNASCSKCSSANQCSDCMPAYYLSGDACLKCGDGCQHCESDTKCNKCFSSFSLVGNACILMCGYGCSSCLSVDSCTVCKDGFYISNKYCYECSTSCAACSNFLACTSCKSGAYLVNGSCKLCNINCKECQTLSSCSSCKPQYYLSSGNCIQCSPNCSTCDQALDNCTGCSAGYFLSSNKCNKCGIGIKICNSTDTIECATGYFLDALYHCIECSDGCSVCANQSYCLKCWNSYYLSGEKCASCPIGCMNCLSSSECINCLSNYKLVNSQCIIFCGESCLSCNIKRECTQCATGFYMGNKICYQCSNGCSKCSLLSHCLACMDGYNLFKHSCIKSNQGCKYSINLYCIECLSRYYQVDNICLPCSHDCMQCNNMAECLQCDSSYYLNHGECTECSANCLACSNSKCDKCYPSYYLNLNGECVECSTSCIECTQFACVKCMAGYTYNETLGYCIKNSNYCILPDGNIGCKACQNSLYLDNNICKKCSEFCLNCVNSAICLECEDGYYLSHGACLKSQAGGKACTTSSICDNCQIGYFMNYDTNNCTKCLSGCASCQSLDICLYCNDGFILVDAACEKCSSGCMQCMDQIHCHVCYEGYYLNINGLCEACMDGCSACHNKLTCDKCIGIKYDSYYNSGTSCLACSSSCAICEWNLTCKAYNNTFKEFYVLQANAMLNCTKTMCKECYPNNECISCYDGYFPSSNGYCIPCLESNCKVCNNYGICEACKEQYYLSTHGACEQGSISNCSSYQNSSLCLTCMREYYLSDNKCIHCELGCLSCLNASYCFRCAPYYHSYSFYQANHNCIQCPLGCYTCNSNLTCQACVKGYALSNSVCVKCNSNCLTCYTETHCKLCSNSYYLLDGSCSKCSWNCLYCNNITDCLICYSGYVLMKGMCKNVNGCGDYCLFCTSSGCSQCEEGYYLENRICLKCATSHCGRCDSLECYSCLNGYYLKSNQCISDFNDADTCNPIDTAALNNYGCPFKFYKNDINQCIRIATPHCCAMYNSICNACSWGYHLTYDLECYPQCSTNCMSCIKPYTCNKCIQGYVLSGTQCIQKCPDFCDSCSTNSTCDKCKPGYSLSSGNCLICTEQHCLTVCANTTSVYGCSLCDSYWHIDNDGKCSECQTSKLAREPMEFDFSLSSGTISLKENGIVVGRAYTGSKLLRYSSNICSSVYKEGAIPIGIYNITDLQCSMYNTSMPRVIKLQPILRFSNSPYYDSIYSNLYIYEPFPDTSYLSKLNGEKGIVANISTRLLFTIGDIINVHYNQSDLAKIISCNPMIPPMIGTASLAVSSSNEVTVYFKDWGGYPSISTHLVYDACIIYSSSFPCISICDSQIISADYIRCNINNSIHLGYYGGGNYSMQYRVQYKGPFDGMHSQTDSSIAINTVQNITPLSIISTINSDTPYQQIIRSMNDIINAYVIAYPDLGSIELKYTCPANYCSNSGACQIINGYAICNCTLNYTGSRCHISKATYNATTAITMHVLNAITRAFQPASALNISAIKAIYAIGIVIHPVLQTNPQTMNATMHAILSTYPQKWSLDSLITISSIVGNLVDGVVYYIINNKSTKRKLGDIPDDSVLRMLMMIESMYDKVLLKKASNNNIFSDDAINSTHVNGTFMKLRPHTAVRLNKTSFSVDTSCFIRSIEYPELLSQYFPTVDGYSIGNTVISVAITFNGISKPLLASTKLTVNFSLSVLGDAIVNDTSSYEIQCAYYNKQSNATQFSLCSVFLNGSIISCSCKGSIGPLYVVYKLRSLPVYVIVISVVISTVVVALTPVIILKCVRRRRLKYQMKEPPMNVS